MSVVPPCVCVCVFQRNISGQHFDFNVAQLRESFGQQPNRLIKESASVTQQTPDTGAESHTILHQMLNYYVKQQRGNK